MLFIGEDGILVDLLINPTMHHFGEDGILELLHFGEDGVADGFALAPKIYFSWNCTVLVGGWRWSSSKIPSSPKVEQL